jgi:AraC-like DNA-binding protein
MSGGHDSPYPHHSWLAHWVGVDPPQVFDLHERRHVGHHLLLTTSGDADIRWMRCGTETAYRSAVGSLGFFPCDPHAHSMAITSANGFMAYDLIIPDQHLRTVGAAEGLSPQPRLQAAPVFRDPLIEASLLRLSSRASGRQVSEDIGDEIAARQILLRLCTLAGAVAPEWQKDGSVFTPATMRQLIVCIDAHLGVPMSLEKLANTVRLSPGHFARKFHQSAGLSLNRFINTRRISAALALLRQGTDPLAGIALDLGFSSQSHFTRLFSGLTGLSPDQFRRLHRRIVG